MENGNKHPGIPDPEEKPVSFLPEKRGWPVDGIRDFLHKDFVTVIDTVTGQQIVVINQR